MKNKFAIDGNITTIELPRGRKSSRTMFATIDTDDLPLMNKFKGFWRPFESRNTFYAVIRHRISGAPIIYMHHVILGTEIDNVVIPDHKNHNGLDNRKENLRLVSRSVNRLNTNIVRSSASGITGVYWHKFNRKWLTLIIRNNKRMHVGYFKTKFKAVEARLIAEQIFD